ncbi:MAG: hypothetical protein AAF389_04230 [Gemmatimonadota bacterium]
MRLLVLMGCAALAVFTPPASAQTTSESELINLFFDCQAPSCRDQDFFRRELPFVNWVLDREVADVHLLVTSQQTGGGGLQYSLAFLGLRDFDGVEHELGLDTSGDATDDERRTALAGRTRMGLVVYVQQTSAAERLEVTYRDPAGEGGPPGGAAVGPEDDPWDFWVFRLGANAFLNGQSTVRSSNTSGSFNASRTTEAWKIDLRTSYRRNKQAFDIPQSDGSILNIEEIRTDWDARGLAVRSLGAHWAIGARTEIGSSTFFNQDLFWAVKPGVEYNFFPYAESDRRSLTAQYLVGPTHFEYNETTIFDKDEETRLQHSLTTALSLVQPWGRWSTSVTGQQYLHDASKYNVTVSGNLNIRLFRGFSIRVGGRYQWLRDQLYIEAQGATPEEILLFQRQLETNYTYFTSFGIEYRFGSIFNNVVNPRFGRGGGGVIFF